MSTLNRWTFCKVLAVVLCLFFALETHVLYAQQAAAISEQQAARFKSAKDSFFAADYEPAKTGLEALIEELETIEGLETFKGQVYLLAGATYEKVDSVELAVMYYCRAKERLGEGKTIEGLELKKLKYYPANCAAVAGIFAAGIVIQDDPYITAYNRAKISYFAAAFGFAQSLIETLIADLGAVDGRDVFKGQVYLLAGAIYEAQKFKELSVKYYCRAKQILGEGKTVEGLELKKLKYYNENCAGAAALAGAAAAPKKRKSFLGGLVGMLLGLAILGGVVWYLFFSPKAPLGKKGKYSSITFRVDVKYRGFNSKGHRKFWIGNDLKNDEDFLYTQNISADTPCTSAVKEENYSYSYAISGDSVQMKQEWLNWDYESFGPGTNWKKLCTDFTVTIEKYEWTSGKDPGKPEAEGLDALGISNINTDCTASGDRIHNCQKTSTITFKAPANPVTARGVTAASSEMIGKY